MSGRRLKAARVGPTGAVVTMLRDELLSPAPPGPSHPTPRNTSSDDSHKHRPPLSHTARAVMVPAGRVLEHGAVYRVAVYLPGDGDSPFGWILCGDADIRSELSQSNRCSLGGKSL